MSDTNEISKAKIINFGTISEPETGRLQFANFHINGANEFNSTEVCLLTLVIRRLQSELCEVEAREAHCLGRGKSEPA